MISHVIDNSTSRLHTAENTSLYFDESSGYIYTAYIGNDLLPTIARAHISNLSYWLTITIDQTPVHNDAHVGIIVSLDFTGHIHIMWSVHNSTDFTYKRSTLPHDLTTLVWASVDVQIPPSRTSPTNQAEISYPRFYRAGSKLYLTLRNGTPGNADQYLLTWDDQLNRWTDSPGIIISSIQSSPYLGVCRGLDNGSLHLIWTNRSGYYNSGLYYGKWDGQSFDSYQVLPTTCSLSNTGLSVLVDGSSVFLFYLMVSETGHPEVYCSTSNDLINWTTSQVTDLSLSRLRGCPAGPVDGPYRPCDMELQGPWTSFQGSSHPLPLHLFYGRSVALPGPLWQRPATILYSSTSYDDGLTWETKELSLPVRELTTEITVNNNSQTLNFALCQDIEGNMRLLNFRDSSDLESELSVSALLPHNYKTRPVYRIDNPSILYTRQNWAVDLIVRPDRSISPMGLIDIGGPSGCRAFRILLWGNGKPLAYSPSHLQILLGDGTGSNWSLIWNPKVEIKPLVYSHLRVERSGNLLSALKLTSTGWAILASTQIISSPVLAVNRFVVIGGVEDAYGAIVESFNYRGFIDINIK